ncbi:hypothetical protein ABPG74_006287 [Tetrahymena malaccensis]
MSNKVGDNMQQNLSDLIKQIDVMKTKKVQVDQEIYAEQQQLMKTEQELQILTNRLNELEEFLAKKQNEKSELNNTIVQTEMARNKIAESYKNYLSFLQQQRIHHLSSQQ